MLVSLRRLRSARRRELGSGWLAALGRQGCFSVLVEVPT